MIPRSRMLFACRLVLAALCVLMATGCGGGRGNGPNAEVAPLPQPTPDPTLDAVVRSVPRLAPLATLTATPLPTRQAAARPSPTPARSR